MHVGMSVIFRNPGHNRPDRNVYRDDIALADLAEPLGFESIWAVEHHFTDYTMCPDPLRFFSFMAGMPHDKARANMELFATKVMPALKALPPAEQRVPGAVAAE